MIRIGPAGWAYKDWKGIVYPVSRRGFDELTFLATYFDTVEINTSFYGPLTEATAQAWLSKIAHNLRFQFTAKLWRGFTHTRNASTQDEALVRAGFAPLAEAGRLGAVLLQFPSAFHNDAENRTYLVELQRRFHDFPLVLEVRHTSWSEPGVLDFLAELGMGLCNIDQPLFRKSIRPSALTTAPVGYVRLHGRNYQSWWTENRHPGERYDYLYSVEELDPWLDRIRTVDEHTTDTYVVTNNHYLGKAVANAFEISSLLTGKTVEAPASLVAAYPELAPFTTTANEQLGLKFPT